ncbi:hypothetical protein [Ectopseudomonas mendocina]|nr:hypothetical protein [Pseudomonas mendocina]
MRRLDESQPHGPDIKALLEQPREYRITDYQAYLAGRGQGVAGPPRPRAP